MSKKKLVFLTEVITILSEKGEEKLAKATSKKPDEDSSGMPYEWYIENNLRPPIGLEPSEDEIDSDGMMILKEGEFTYDFLNRFFDVSDFFTAVEGDEFGTVITFLNGREYLVDEDILEVYERIRYAQRDWFERLKDSVLVFFAKFKNKKQILDNENRDI